MYATRHVYHNKAPQLVCICKYITIFYNIEQNLLKNIEIMLEVCSKTYL